MLKNWTLKASDVVCVGKRFLTDRTVPDMLELTT